MQKKMLRVYSKNTSELESDIHSLKEALRGV